MEQASVLLNHNHSESPVANFEGLLDQSGIMPLHFFHFYFIYFMYIFGIGFDGKSWAASP